METRTAGSASGLGKRTSSNAGTAPQADSTQSTTLNTAHEVVLRGSQTRATRVMIGRLDGDPSDRVDVVSACGENPVQLRDQVSERCCGSVHDRDEGHG